MNAELFYQLHGFRYLNQCRYEGDSLQQMQRVVAEIREEKGFPEGTFCNCRGRRGSAGRCDDDKCILYANFMDCPPACNCENQKVSGRLDYEDHLRIIPFEGKGHGLVTTVDIPQGEYIIEYTGIVRTRPQVYEDQSYHFDFRQWPDHFIDATVFGNASRMINHSCLPNCAGVEWIVGSEMRVIINSIRDIRAGEELTLYYGWLVRQNEYRRPCFCGQPPCNGRMEQWENSIRCRLCYRVYADQHSLDSHTRDMHGEQQGREFGCEAPMCGRRFKREKDLQAHLRTHEARANREKFYCRFCGREYLSDRARTNHEAGCEYNDDPPPDPAEQEPRRSPRPSGKRPSPPPEIEINPEDPRNPPQDIPNEPPPSPPRSPRGGRSPCGRGNLHS